MNQMNIQYKELITRLQSEMGNRFPNTFIVGAPKCGTTSLFRYLDFSHDVFAASVKEPSFFSNLDRAISKVDWFNQLYINANESIRLNGTSINFYGSHILPSLIKSINSDVKIIILLRNPVDRFFSFYRFLKHMNYKGSDVGIDKFIDGIVTGIENDSYMENNDFHIDGKRYIESTLIGGNYADHLSNWINHFDDNVKIGFFDDLKYRPKEFMIEISSFLDIENVWNKFKFEVENQTIIPKNRTLHNVLIAFYSRFSTSLNKNKKMKRRLLNFYKNLNANTKKDNHSTAANLFLKNYYQTDINKTRDIILDHSNFCIDLPSWLSLDESIYFTK